MTKAPIDSKIAGERNEILVLNVLRRYGRLSQAQICRRTGLGSSTISYIVGRLREKNLIQEQPGKSAKRGAKPIIISINAEGRYIVGVELNPSSILMGLFDFNCRLIDETAAPLGDNHSESEVVRVLEINLLGLLSKNNTSQEKLLGIGVTLSGSVSSDGVIELSSPLGWKDVPLKDILSSKLACPVSIYSTRVRLLAELNINPDLASKNVLYLNVASGVGSTVSVMGRLAEGASGRYGEFGHIICEPDGPVCGCGHKGCLEALISGTAIANKIKNDIQNGKDTVLSKSLKKGDTPENIILKWGKALEQNDSYALSICDYVAEHLSRAASVAINLYDPDVIILAGYVAMQCVSYLTHAIKKRMTTDVYDNSSRKIDIIAARAGREALISGVATAILSTSMEAH